MKLAIKYFTAYLYTVVSLCTVHGSVSAAPFIYSAQGVMPNEYAVVYTTITNDPQSSQKPIVQRAVKGIIRPALPSVRVQESLRLPENIIQFKTQIPDMIARIAGAVDPTAGVIASSASIIVNEMLDFAGRWLTDLYGKDPFTLTLLELLPTQYYAINETTGMVETKPAFTDALENYNKLLDEYFIAARRYNEAASAYNQKYRQWLATGNKRLLETQENRALINDLKSYHTTYVTPLLQQRLSLEAQLERFALHRVVLMASPQDKGVACEQAGGAWSGPFGLRMYYYIGARQTNIFEIGYCAKENPEFIVNLTPNSKDANRSFRPGGVQLLATNSKTIGFPSLQQAQAINYTDPSSPVFDWFSEVIVADTAGGVDQFLFPFDINTMRNKFEELQRKTHDKDLERRVEVLDKNIKEYKKTKTMTKQELAVYNKQKAELSIAQTELADAQEEYDTAVQELAKLKSSSTATPVQIKAATANVDKLKKQLRTAQAKVTRLSAGSSVPSTSPSTQKTGWDLFDNDDDISLLDDEDVPSLKDDSSLYSDDDILSSVDEDDLSVNKQTDDEKPGLFDLDALIDQVEKNKKKKTSVTDIVDQLNQDDTTILNPKTNQPKKPSMGDPVTLEDLLADL